MPDPADWLVQEVRDLLDTSSVGLYEFIWMLRGAYPDAREEDLRSWAAKALGNLLEEQQARLVRLLWPSEDSAETWLLHELPADAWDDPQAGEPYLAITRS